MGDEDLRSSLREDIESAMGEDTPEGGLPAEGGAAPEPGALPASPPAEATPPASLDGEPKGAPERDSMGRFLPKTAKAAPGAPETPPGTQPPAQPVAAQPAPAQAPAQGAPAAPAVPAPASWSFGAREQWANTPAAVQQEVARREHQMQRFVNDTAPARQLGEGFWQTVQPYMAAIQAEGVDPLTAASNLFQFGARMRLGTPGERATTLARIATVYGVDIGMLDGALRAELEGRPQQPQANGGDPNYVQQIVHQTLQPLYQAAQQRQFQLQQQANATAQSAQDAFAADPKHKYFPDLRNIMADLVEAAQKRGGDMSLEDAYARAALLHPEISKIIIAQQQGANAHQLTAAAQRAKAAAVSVNGSAPVGNPNAAEPNSIRESIEAAIELHSRY